MFTSTAAHAFRALSALATHEGQAVLGRDLAQEADVPPNYLSKILLALNKAGVVEATRGQGGGYRLQRPAEDITLAEVLKVFEPSYDHDVCFLGAGRECSDDNACSAHGRWKEVKTAYLEFTRTTTLAEMAHGGEAQVPPGL